jgi:hypothetical protein
MPQNEASSSQASDISGTVLCSTAFNRTLEGRRVSIDAEYYSDNMHFTYLTDPRCPEVRIMADFTYMPPHKLEITTENA